MISRDRHDSHSRLARNLGDDGEYYAYLVNNFRSEQIHDAEKELRPLKTLGLPITSRDVTNHLSAKNNHRGESVGHDTSAAADYMLDEEG